MRRILVSVLAAFAAAVSVGCRASPRSAAVAVPAELASSCSLRPPESFAFDRASARPAEERLARCLAAPSVDAHPALLDHGALQDDDARRDAVTRFLLDDTEPRGQR